MSTYQIVEQRFGLYLQPEAALQTLYTGTAWAEGPVYISEGNCLLWSDIPNNRMLRWAEGQEVRVFREPSNFSNGNTLDRQGRLVTCEHGARRVTRTEKDGRITVLADNYRGKRLNSPNDVVVKRDGSIWFTDPPYGILSDREGYQAESELGKNYLFCLEPHSGRLEIVADDFDKPNGLAFSPDETRLYVSDTGASHDPDGPHHIRAFDVREGNALTNSRVFADISPGLADGLRVDIDGNVWTSAGDGVHCYDPAGTLLGKIFVPEVVANVTFGGAQRTRLFITATTSLYALELRQRGV